MQDYTIHPENYKTLPKTYFPAKHNDIIEQHLNDRLQTLVWVLTDIQNEIQARIQLRDTIIEHLNDSVCELTSRLYQFENALPCANIHTTNQLLTQIESFKAEKRTRETESWRDIAQLKREFRMSFQEYRRVQGRHRILAVGGLDEMQ